MTCRHKWARYLDEIKQGFDKIRVGCKHCDAVLTVKTDARASLAVEKVFDAIEREGEADINDIKEHTGLQSRGHIMRILMDLVEEERILRWRRGLYGINRRDKTEKQR